MSSVRWNDGGWLGGCYCWWWRWGGQNQFPGVICIPGKSLFNDFPVKLVLVSNVVVPISVATLSTQPPAYQNKEGQNSQVLCPSECFKAKCVIVFTRREAVIAAQDEG